LGWHHSGGFCPKRERAVAGCRTNEGPPERVMERRVAPAAGYGDARRKPPATATRHVDG
jgi:hypothetical protein